MAGLNQTPRPSRAGTGGLIPSRGSAPRLRGGGENLRLGKGAQSPQPHLEKQLP